MKDQATSRSCATCCAYECGECMNGLGAVTPGDVCDQHKSHEQEKRDDEAMTRFRAAAGLPPRRFAS